MQMHGPMPGQWGWGRGNTELEMTFGVENVAGFEIGKIMSENSLCLLYTSDAADD